MPEGVEILRETLYYSDFPIWVKIAAMIILLILFVYGIYLAVTNGNGISFDFEEFIGALLGMVSFLLITVGICSNAFFTQKPDRYEYIIFVKEQEPVVKELYKNYDVISIDGDIWTIRDRE